MTAFGTSLSAGYDPSGQRAWKQGSGGKAYTFYDGSSPVAETTSNGTLLTVDTFGPMGLLSSQTGSGETDYAFDARGNVAQRLSSSGSVVSSDAYNAYGQKLAGNPGGDEFGFGGQAGYRTDPETGLCLLGQRYYDPSAGRFLTRDPAGYAGGMDLYAYTDDDPVNNLDPSGLTDCLSDDDGGPECDKFYTTDLSTRDPGMVQAGLDAGSSLIHQVPVVGAGFYISDAATGCDVLSNRDLSTGQRWMAGVNAALNLLGARYGGEGEAADEGVAAEEGAAARGGCFVAGTPVQTAHGGRPIQRVRRGDLVWSRDPVTGRTELRRVVRTYKHLAHETITVRLADRAGKVVQTLVATPQHPFFVPGRGAVPLRSLGIGTQVVARAGPPLVVKSLVRHEYPRGIPVYNFEVQGDHTYFVGTADQGVWVHNSCGGGGYPAVIGRARDVEPFYGDAGYNTLNMPTGWSPEVNAQWITDAYNSGQDIILATPIDEFGPGQGQWTLQELYALHSMPDGGIEVRDLIDQLEKQSGFTINDIF